MRWVVAVLGWLPYGITISRRNLSVIVMVPDPSVKSGDGLDLEPASRHDLEDLDVHNENLFPHDAQLVLMDCVWSFSPIAVGRLARTPYVHGPRRDVDPSDSAGIRILVDPSSPVALVDRRSNHGRAPAEQHDDQSQPKNLPQHDASFDRPHYGSVCAAALSRARCSGA